MSHITQAEFTLLKAFKNEYNLVEIVLRMGFAECEHYSRGL
jgi:hypothetical protein